MHFTEAVRGKPHVPSYTALGSLAAKRGDAAAAYVYLEKALEFDPRFVPARLALARVIWIGRKDPATALTLIRDGLELEPENDKLLNLFREVRRARNAAVPPP